MFKYFDGSSLFGDDFDLNQITRWFEEEEEGYSSLVQANIKEYSYPYSAMNYYYGFRHIENKKEFENVLGFGSAYGHEFLNYTSRIKHLTILEPSNQFITNRINDLIPAYKKPTVKGNIEFDDNSFDLITCFGVLHHIPNVEFVTNEMLRVLKPGGFLLLREPIRSMGDWRITRIGLTKNERGIPADYFDNLIKLKNIHNVKIVKKEYCDSAFFSTFLRKMFNLKIDNNNLTYQKWDRFLSKLFSFNVHYHPKNMVQKIGPSSVFYIFTKS